jgi:hypothetical protein
LNEYDYLFEKLGKKNASKEAADIVLRYIK